jgi:hypothetical protein
MDRPQFFWLCLPPCLSIFKYLVGIGQLANNEPLYTGNIGKDQLVHPGQAIHQLTI